MSFNENDRKVMDPAIEATYCRKELNDIVLQKIRSILISKQTYNVNRCSMNLLRTCTVEN